MAARVRAWLARGGLVMAMVLITVILGLAKPGFLSLDNLVMIGRQIAINGILAVGVTYVLLTGGVDLSLGSVVALAGVVAASFAHPGEHVVLVPIAMGILVGAGCGAVNGTIVTRGRVPSFIVTLGMMTVARGLALVLSGGRPVSNLSREFAALGGSSVAGIPVPALILGLLALASAGLLRHTRLGRHIYAVGGNEKAARAAGIRVDGVKVFAYTLCGALAGLAGVVLASRITTGQPNAGMAYELDAIAAVVIGGTSLSGGVGTIGGTVLGAILMGVISSGLDQLNVSSYYQQMVKGLIIVGAVWWDCRKQD